MKRWWIVFCLLLVFVGCSPNQNSVGLKKADALVQLEKNAEKLGLEQVQVKFVKTIKNELFVYDMFSSNFDQLSYDQMLSFAKEVNGTMVGVQIRYFIVGEDEYEVFTGTRCVYKNGVIVYDDFFDEEKETSKGNESHPFIPEEYQYDVENYENAEDFYYDYYDDFADFEEAEEYFEAYTGH